MDDLNVIGVVEIEHLQQITTSGGSIKGWGWLGVAAAEIIDVITSAGENLKKAHQNGYEVGIS